MPTSLTQKLTIDNRKSPWELVLEKQIAHLPLEMKKQYPSHIFEPVRIEIARQLAVKECYKLLPFLSHQDFEKLHETMGDWLIGNVADVTPIHDFWNLLEGLIVSLKGKDIIAQVTSAHIAWQQEELDVRAVALYWPIGGLDKLGQPPYSYPVVEKNILRNTKKQRAELRASDEYAANTKLPRDHFPIIVRRDKDGGLQLLDGNRRTFRAWLQGRKTLPAWVGTVIKNPPLYNHWVNKGFLRRLVAEYMNTPTRRVKAITRQQLQQVFASSEIARIQYRKYCVPYNATANELVEGLL